MRDFILDIDFFFPDDGKPFWRVTRRLQTIFRCIFDSGLGVELKFYRPEDDVFPILDFDNLLTKSAHWASGGHQFSSSSEVRGAATRVDLTLASDQVRLMIILSKSHADSRPDAYERFVDLAVKFQAEFSEEVSFSGQMALRATGVDWVRPVPPRNGDGWSLGVPVVFFSKRSYERPNRNRPDDLPKLMETPMPEGCRREDWGDIVALRFARTLDESEVLEACARQDLWFSEVLDLPHS